MLALTGCAGDRGDDEADLVSREALVSTFEAAGERVGLSIDIAKADPSSSVDAFYVSRARRDGEPLFEIGLFEDRDSARKHIVSVQTTPESNLYLFREKNVVLGISPSVAAERRARLVALLESL